MIEGRKTFRFDTFGDEAFWEISAKLHQAIGPYSRAARLSPAKALELNKVDPDDPRR